jgi:DNA invertase Pin-like site-specific DNA recombinase
MKKVAIYIRVSTDQQNTDFQIQDLSEYAERREFEVYKVYEDRLSGATKSRPELDKLFADAKKKRFDVVLVWRFDRFARSLKMLVEALELFNDLGINFISYSENLDTTTHMGKLIFHINSAYAEFEREIIRERVISGIRAKRSKNADEWGRPELSPEVQEKIKTLRAGGLSIRKTADKLHISTRTVQKYKSN